MAAGMTRGAISKKLGHLATTGKIGKNIKTKTIGYEYKVWLENDEDYTMFFLVWQPDNSWQHPRLINEVYRDEKNLRQL